MPSKPPKSPKFSFGEQSEKCLKRVHPHLIALAYKALELSVIDFGIHSGCRTMEQQKRLVAEGRSKLIDSRHVPMGVRAGGNAFGHAIDCHVWLPGRPQDAFDWPLLRKVYDAFFAASKILLVEFAWGGEWRHNPDGPHFELPSHAYPKDMPVKLMPWMEKPKKPTRRGTKKTRTVIRSDEAGEVTPKDLEL